MSEWIKRQDAIDIVAKSYRHESDRVTALQELSSIDLENLKEDLMHDSRIGRKSLDAFLEILGKYDILETKSTTAQSTSKYTDKELNEFWDKVLD